MTADEMWGLWTLLPAAALGSFLALELPAVRTHEWARTLSDTLRRWMGLVPKHWRRWVTVPLFTLIMFGFPVWFWPHIVLQAW